MEDVLRCNLLLSAMMNKDVREEIVGGLKTVCFFVLVCQTADKNTSVFLCLSLPNSRQEYGPIVELISMFPLFFWHVW